MPMPMSMPSPSTSRPERKRVVALLLERIREADLSLSGLEIAESAELGDLLPVGGGRLGEVIADVLRDLGRHELAARLAPPDDHDTLGQLADRLASA